MTFVAMVHSPDGALVDTLGVLPGPRLFPLPGYNGFVMPLFESSSLASARGTTIAMTTARDPEVRILDEEFRLRRITRW